MDFQSINNLKENVNKNIFNNNTIKNSIIEINESKNENNENKSAKLKFGVYLSLYTILNFVLEYS